ncbi:MAG TPA: alpha/beta-hydrolase family protein [Natronosporangium sp.]|nr:alpha/beta-hydrolase family protein [Natronosporangium sp.]
MTAVRPAPETHDRRWRADRPGRWWSEPPGRVVRRGLGFGGSIGLVLLFCLSLTPSLLPRHWVLQGVLSGITGTIGYGVGAGVGALARTVWPRLPPPSPRAWQVLAGVSGGLMVVFLLLGDAWQREVRELVGLAPATGWSPLLIAAVAAVVFGVLLLAARGVRLATRKLAGTIARFSPRPVASVAAVTVVIFSSYVLTQEVVVTGFVDAAGRVASAASSVTPPGVDRPDSPYRSGGPGSLVPWETLGRYGREFTAGAVPRAELAAFTGEAAKEPVRVYVGQKSAAGLDARVDLAVRELRRTGGFDRGVLAVVVTTGTGWVNPAVPRALEYLSGGDSAVVAMQYSYLPSWISYLADRSTVAEAAAALIKAVRAELATVPASQRPELVVYGESLGAFGIEQAFGSLPELIVGTDGALLVGPPHTSPIWQGLVASREGDSPVWQPVHRGSVRFAQDGTELSNGGRPRVVYLQNATDPVVWWSPQLLYQEPAWLEESRGSGVSGAMRWYPLVTFWQVTVDTVTSTTVPPGHGHNYRESIADAWAAMLDPPGWTDADTARLRSVLTRE